MKRYLQTVLLLAAFLLSACGTTGTVSTVDGEKDLPVRNESNKLAQTNVQLGVGYMQQGKYEFALSKFRKALEIDNSMPEAHYAIALLYEKLNKQSHAERHFKRTLELSPQYSDAYNAYGVFLCRNGKFEEADEQFTKALENPLYKTPLQAMLNAGVCLMRSDLTGSDARAEEYFRKVLQKNPRVPEALLNMSRLSVEQGDYLRGRAYLQRYLNVARHTAETLWLGVQIEQQLGDEKALASYSRKLRNDFPDSDEAKKLDKSHQ